MLPGGGACSQLIASACRDELGADACIVNGGPIKGGREYPTGQVT